MMAGWFVVFCFLGVVIVFVGGVLCLLVVLRECVVA
jgi:hypothetical protein